MSGDGVDGVDKVDGNEVGLRWVAAAMEASQMEGMLNFGKLVATFYLGLIAEGLEEAAAVELVRVFIGEVMHSAARQSREAS